MMLMDRLAVFFVVFVLATPGRAETPTAFAVPSPPAPSEMVFHKIGEAGPAMSMPPQAVTADNFKDFTILWKPREEGYRQTGISFRAAHPEGNRNVELPLFANPEITQAQVVREENWEMSGLSQEFRLRKIRGRWYVTGMGLGIRWAS